MPVENVPGSSPHTRGARGRVHRRRRPKRIIPAYAGSTCPSSQIVFSMVDHPRIRGEHAVSPTKTPKNRGSSPHTRGAPDRVASVMAHAGIIPAYAGSTLTSPTNSLTMTDHPRIRGEHESG